MAKPVLMVVVDPDHREELATALLLADQRLEEMAGVEFLRRAHELHPAARRVVLCAYGDVDSGFAALQAMSLGQLDHWLNTPFGPPEPGRWPDRPCCWRPACRACSRPVTSATARSSGSPRPSARAPSPSSSSTSTWPSRCRPRRGRPGADERAPQAPMATGRPATARSRAVIPAQPGVGAAAAGE